MDSLDIDLDSLDIDPDSLDIDPDSLDIDPDGKSKITQEQTRNSTTTKGVQHELKEVIHVRNHLSVLI